MEDVYAYTTSLLERVKFYSAKQEDHEGIKEYLLRLKDLAKLCEFGGFYFEAIRDRFVIGMRNIETRNILLYTRNLTLEQAEDIALAREAFAERNPTIIEGLENLSTNAITPISNDTLRPYVAKNEKTQGSLRTLNPQPLICPPQPNQGTINDANSPAQHPTSHHTSMPGTSKDPVVLFQNSPNANTQARLTSTSNSQLKSHSAQRAPSMSYEQHTYVKNEQRSPSSDTPSISPIKTSAISPIKTPDGKKSYPCPHCEKTFANKSWLNAHILKHSSERKFPCRYCQKRLKTEGSRRNHETMNCKKNPDQNMIVKKEGE